MFRNLSKTKNRSAFTLIEILLVLATIGLITALATVAYNQSRVKSRDNKRASDIISIQQALERYHRQEGSYPATLTFGQPLVGSSGITYLNVPAPTTPNDGGCSTTTNAYTYEATNNNQKYTINFCLGNKTGEIAAGNNCANQDTISSGSCFICGDTLTLNSDNLLGYTCNADAPNYDTCEYATIKIGNQCWLKENMNIGTIIDGSVDQTDNSPTPILEKYCYDPDGDLSDYTYCQLHGGLYQWDEAMQYSLTPSAQGICPDGWHIPSHDEWTTLERAVCTSGTCATDFPYDNTTTGFRGTDEGTKLLIGGSSGFDVLLSGTRYTASPFFRYLGAEPTLWTSSLIDTNKAWQRNFVPGYAVWRNYILHPQGLSIRCVRD
ncbi:MAG TPA: FISUMP domain-containing protein [bacterium]|nr:FISUMP domain-containing protein [bacterium]HPT29507.1 FISUMP domain-containing protein [bacterium]